MIKSPFLISNLLCNEKVIVLTLIFSSVLSLQGTCEEGVASYHTQELIPLWTATKGYIPSSDKDTLQLDPRGNLLAFAYPVIERISDILIWESIIQIRERKNENYRAGLALITMDINNPKLFLGIGLTQNNRIEIYPSDHYPPTNSSTIPITEKIKISIHMNNSQYMVFINGQHFIDIPAPKNTLLPAVFAQFCSATFTEFHLVLKKTDNNKFHKFTEPNITKPYMGAPQNKRTLPRIRLNEKNDKKNFIKEDTSEVFVPRGFNHVVLEHRNSGWHALFNTNVYNQNEIESVLKQIAECGGNVIRVWAWGTQNEYGFLSNKNGTILNPDYMKNFIDFLRKATEHNIYVIPILDEYPKYGNFEKILADLHLQSNRDDPYITGYNCQFFWESFIKAKAIAIKHFIQYIKDTDPSLLTTVLAWSLQNEVFLMNSEGPFSSFTAEILLPDGSKRNVSTQEERQKIYDIIILNWANELTKAVKSVDPLALVTVGMWTSDSAGRKPTNGLLFDGKDFRFPPRPSILGGDESLLDFIDIHIYPWDNTSKVNHECHEYGLVKKPVIVGEYGVFQNVSVEQAKTILIEFLQQAYQMGYKGDLYWVWDLTAIPEQTYSAITEGFAQHVMQWNEWKQYFTK